MPAASSLRVLPGWTVELAGPAADRFGLQLLVCLAALGLAAGAAASLLSLAREHRRRRFVALVEAGQQEGFRVDATRAGKVLVRVSPAEREGYRVADLEEELFELDARGLAVQPAAGAEGVHQPPWRGQLTGDGHRPRRRCVTTMAAHRALTRPPHRRDGHHAA